MARPRNSVPTYRFHARSGKGRITVADHLGRRKEMFLPGAFNSGESLKEYERILGILRTHGGKLPPPASGLDLTINELVLAFIERKAEVDYIDAEGKPTTEQRNFRAALAPMLRLYGSMLAADFGSLELKAVQRAMASGSWMTPQDCEVRTKNGKPIGWCRKLVNQHVSRMRSLFKWAVSEKLASPMQLVELQSVSPLKRGRGAREAEPVLPVDPEIVQKTLPHLPPHVRDMVLFQLRIGARPGEVCAMRARDIDRSVWTRLDPSGSTASPLIRLPTMATLARSPSVRRLKRRFVATLRQSARTTTFSLRPGRTPKSRPLSGRPGRQRCSRRNRIAARLNPSESRGPVSFLAH